MGTAGFHLPWVYPLLLYSKRKNNRAICHTTGMNKGDDFCGLCIVR
jgi:hypothetical protein